MGLDTPGGAQSDLTELRQGRPTAPPAGAGRWPAGVDQVVEQIETDAHRTRPGGGVPAVDEERRGGPGDGGVQHSARGAGAGRLQGGRQGVHLARTATRRATWCSPNSTRSAPRRWIRSTPSRDTARAAQPNTTLADATISMGGYPVALRDTRDYYQRRHPVHRRRHPHRRAADPDAAAAGDRRTAVSRWLGGDFVLRGARHRRPDLPVRASTSRCTGPCRRWPSWCWSRWAPTTTCCSRRECATSRRTAPATASSGRCRRPEV